MKTTTSPKSRTLLVALSLAALTAGCVGNGPNTQQGAVGGAALGALAGAIIGNNSGSHDALGGAVIGGVAGGVAGGVIGNQVDHQRGTIYRSEAEATTAYVADAPPPPPPAPREVVVVRPAERSAIWVRGYWAYAGREGRNDRYAWVAGHWEAPPERANAFVEPHWAQRGHSYVYVQGYWR
jgi:hypothetical protein